MAPETWMPADDAERTPDAVELARLQAEAAQSAETVGAFRSNFRRMIDIALTESDIHNKSLANERLDAVESVVSGHEDIRLDSTESGVLGWNTIGGGRSGIHLSRDMFANADTSDAADIDQVVAHEGAHGKQVQLSGELIVDGASVDHLELLEGHAEIVSNEKTGKGLNAHRDGQPAELYRDGQDAVVKILNKVSRAKFESVLTGSGDLSQLQRAIDGRAKQPTETQHALAL